MGKMIVSWSPVHGQGGTTSNLAALAALFSQNTRTRNLITHTQLTYSSLESLFGKVYVDNGFEDRGMSALERLAKSGLLKPEAVMDYTETIYSKKLDILGGGNDSGVNPELLQKLLAVTNDAYDAVWVDAHSGTRNTLTNHLLEMADVVIVNLPCNRFILDRFFSGADFPDVLKDKPYIILLSNFDEHSSFSFRRITRKYKIKQPIFPVYYSRQFKDAANQMGLVEFFYRNNTSIKDAPTELFIGGLKNINKQIIKMAGFKSSLIKKEDIDE